MVRVGDDSLSGRDAESFQRLAQRAVDPGPDSRVRVPGLRKRSRPGIAQVDQPACRAAEGRQAGDEMSGVRRAAAHDDMRLESPDHRARAQCRPAHPAAALVGKGQQRPRLPTQPAEPSPKRRFLHPGRDTRSIRGRAARRPEGPPAEQPPGVEERPEARAPLDGDRTRCAVPARWRGGEHRNLPAQPSQVFRDARPAQTSDGAIGTEVIGDDQQAACAHGRPSDPRRAARTSSRTASNRPRCRTRQASP